MDCSLIREFAHVLTAAVYNKGPAMECDVFPNSAGNSNSYRHSIHILNNAQLVDIRQYNKPSLAAFTVPLKVTSSAECPFALASADNTYIMCEASLDAFKPAQTVGWVSFALADKTNYAKYQPACR